MKPGPGDATKLRGALEVAHLGERHEDQRTLGYRQVAIVKDDSHICLSWQGRRFEDAMGVAAIMSLEYSRAVLLQVRRYRGAQVDPQWTRATRH